MSVDSELLAEIKDQLQDDILNFGWLCQIVRLKNPHHTEADRIGAVVDAVIGLHQDGTIIVGRARETDGTVLIDPWPERNHELRARIESAIDNATEEERDFCFWIQLAEHATREQ
jgi:hypothetical protein